MKRVLLTDHIAPEAIDVFAAYDDIEAVATGTLPLDELKATLPDFDAVIVRSPTRLTADVIEAGTRLAYIGRAGVGVDNIDVDAATRKGIVVMNSPGGNTVSTAEHTIAMILAAARRVAHAHASLAAGEWDRAAFKGTELFDKTLGVVGLGRVGREVAKRLRAFDMRVVASDPFLKPEDVADTGVELVALPALLAEADVVTIHVPLGVDTTGMIGAAEIAAMKDGVIVVNCARGGVVAEDALLDALESGKVSAAALDVFETEPPNPGHRLTQHPRCVCTPHLGAATREGQLRVATDIARSVADALASGTVRDAVNAPS